MIIKNPVNGKEIDTTKPFNLKDYIKENSKAVYVILAPRNIGKTWNLKDLFYEEISNNYQPGFVRNTPTEANGFWNELKKGDTYEKVGLTGAIYDIPKFETIKEKSEYVKNKNNAVGFLTGFKQMEFWRSNNLFPNMRFIVHDEVITERSLAELEFNVFERFCDYLYTFERFKTEFNYVFISNKVATTCDLFWKLGINFKNTNEFQVINEVLDTCEDGTELRLIAYWLPQFEYNPKKGKSLACAIASKCDRVNDYLNGGLALRDNSINLMTEEQAKQCTYYYTLGEWVGELSYIHHVGTDNCGNTVVWDNPRQEPSKNKWAIGNITPDKTFKRISNSDLEDLCEQLMYAQNSSKLYYSSLFTESYIKQLINSVVDKE